VKRKMSGAPPPFLTPPIFLVVLLSVLSAHGYDVRNFFLFLPPRPPPFFTAGRSQASPSYKYVLRPPHVFPLSPIFHPGALRPPCPTLVFLRFPAPPPHPTRCVFAPPIFVTVASPSLVILGCFPHPSHFLLLRPRTFHFFLRERSRWVSFHPFFSFSDASFPPAKRPRF